MPSDGGEEAVAPTQAEQDEHHATGMQPIVRGVSIVSKVEDVYLLTRLFPKESCLKLESTIAYLGPGRIPSDDFVVQVQTHGVPGCDAGSGEGHVCLCSSLLYWVAARSGMETIVFEVRQ